MSDSTKRVFTDDSGDAWHVRVSVATLNRVRESAVDFDLMQMIDHDHLVRLVQDPALLVAVLYEVLRPQIESRGLEPEEFAERFAGDVIDRAMDRLIEATADFFQNARQRENLHKLWATSRRATDRAQELLGEIIDHETSEEKVEAMVRKAVDDLRPKTPGDQSTSASPSSA